MSKKRQPTGEQFRNFRDHPRKGPVQMINLLKFRDRATYKEGEVEVPDVSGREAYRRYGVAMAAMVADVGGRVVLTGQPEGMFIGNDADLWDEVLVVEYPSRDAFLQMLSMPEYRAVHMHRDAGLDHQQLIQCRPGGDAIG